MLGLIGLDEKLVLDGYDGLELVGTFSGDFSDPLHYNGQWYNADSTQSLPFSMKGNQFQNGPSGMGRELASKWHL